ncbi:MAG: hypothetical protein OXH09_25120 [Gammaproteobacteria bacterium]|nr:hypothetical protein [Gammaproteobacteria bacterium]
MPGSRSRTAASRRKWRRAVVPGAVAAALCVAVALAVRTTPTDPPPQTAPTVETVGPVVETPAAHFPPPAAAKATPPTNEETTAPCAGCLDEAAARDVAEALVVAAGLVYQGVRLERAHDLPWYTKESRWPPVPTDGQLDAPEYFSFGPSLPMPPCRGYEDPNCRGPREEWWIVWFHVGWRTPDEVELEILYGNLPEVAVAWPPIKREEYVVVDARNGEIVGYSKEKPYSPRPDSLAWAYWSAKERARHHLGDAAQPAR